MIRTLTRTIGAITALAVASLLVLAPSAAHANADGCTSSPVGCVKVVGTGLYVKTAQGGTRLAPRASTYGHSEIWGSGFHVNTGNKTLTNTVSTTQPVTVWDYQAVSVNRNLPNASTVCARWWAYYNGAYHGSKIACVTIHS